MYTSGPAIEIVALAKRFKGGAGIGDVSFSVPCGSVTGFIGVNGAGKSTTLRCILGLLEPDAGTIRIFGQPVSSALRRRIGFLPEERGLFPHERARDAIAFHGRLKGMGRAAAYAAADRLLDRVGLAGRKRDRLESFSKGNVQRVQVLCALVHEPRLLLLDEPLSGLDLRMQAEMVSLLSEYRSRGAAILFSTHSMPAAEAICDRVVMLAGGRSVFEGTVKDAFGMSPHGAVVQTVDAEGLAAAAASIGGQCFALPSALGEAGRWRVVMPGDVTHPVLIRALADHAVPVLAFSPIKSDLESTFWHLSESAVLPPAQGRAA
jgi:ABC-2 type transport system ATP-binding protein